MNLENMLQQILENTNKMSKTLDNHGERLTQIENIVTRMEAEHGEKLQVLFDYFVTDSTRFQEIKEEIAKINTTLDKHDARLFYLEFHKDKLLSEA